MRLRGEGCCHRAKVYMLWSMGQGWHGWEMLPSEVHARGDGSTSRPYVTGRSSNRASHDINLLRIMSITPSIAAYRQTDAAMCIRMYFNHIICILTALLITCIFIVDCCICRDMSPNTRATFALSNIPLLIYKHWTAYYQNSEMCATLAGPVLHHTLIQWQMVIERACLVN